MSKFVVSKSPVEFGVGPLCTVLQERGDDLIVEMQVEGTTAAKHGLVHHRVGDAQVLKKADVLAEDPTVTQFFQLLELSGKYLHRANKYPEDLDQLRKTWPEDVARAMGKVAEPAEDAAHG